MLWYMAGQEKSLDVLLSGQQKFVQNLKDVLTVILVLTNED